MGLPRITPSEASEVERLKALGRTNSQIEKIVGIATGVLSGRYTVGDDARPIMDRSPYGNGWRYDEKPKGQD